MVTVKLKRGSGIPTTEQIAQFELGWSVDNKKLYINDAGTVRLAAGAISLSLNGATATNEGSFSFYAPSSVTTNEQGKLLKIKSTVTAGEDPFEFISIDASVTENSNNLVTSDAVYDGLFTKVDKVTGSSLLADTEITRLAGIESGAQVNLIEAVQLNGVALTIASKTVNVDGVEITSNKVTSISSSSTDTQYPTAKLLYDQLNTKLTRSVTASGVTSSFSNTGTEVNITHAVASGSSVKLHFESGLVYLAKYSTGDTPVYGDGNKLLNKAEVAAMITGDASRLITSRTGEAGSYVYEAFETAAALFAGPYFYQTTQFNEESLTRNDYAYVKDDENHDDKQSMYVWDGTDWIFAITFSEGPLIPDNETLELYDDTGVRIKDLGVTTAKIYDEAVTTDKIADANVTLEKLVSTIGTGHGRIVGYNSEDASYIVTLNNQIASPSSLFAPTTSGTTGQYLEANTDSAPTWKNFPTIPTITLNGSATTTASFFAPTESGTAGYLLISGGANTAPSWTNQIDGGSWTVE